MRDKMQTREFKPTELDVEFMRYSEHLVMIKYGWSSRSNLILLSELG